ncbi:hypothetical protein Prudu_000765, partial [Prunus dulcis]
GNMVSPIKLMIAEEEKFQGKALSLSYAKTAISTVKEKFSEQQLRRFEESCFGHLLLIEDLKWTLPIVHGLLLRKADLKTVSQVNGIKFIVGNKVIQFKAQQFCVITGLRKYFGNNKTVNLLELEKAFHDYADADDVLKLGFVYFAVFALLGSEKHVHIDMQYLKLAEHLEEFGKYPWGAMCYAETNASLLRALCADYQRVKVPKKLRKQKKSEKRAKTMATGRPREYNLKGFAFALQVDVQLLRPSVIDKRQPYWTWGDSVDDTEELVELLGDDAEQKTSTSAFGKLATIELHTLKRDFQRTKDELAKVASSNRALHNKVHELEEMVRNESLKREREIAKNNKCVEDVRGEGHEELGSPHMNEGGDNDLSPLHDCVSPPTEPATMETEVPTNGAEPFAAMVVEEAEMATLVPHLQVHEAAEQAQSEKLPTLEDVAGYDEICQRLLFLLEDWKITDNMPSGGPMNPPSMPKVSMVGDEEGKGCRQKRPAQTLLSPFTDPLRKKRTVSVSNATATPPCFDPSKPLPIEDVKAVIEFCTAWKNDISAEVQLESFSVALIFFYKLIDETEWISSRYIQFLEPFKATAKKRGSKKAVASNSIDLPPSKLNMYITMCAVHGNTDSEVEEVKQNGLKMSRFTPFSVCNIADVPQQRDECIRRSFAGGYTSTILLKNVFVEWNGEQSKGDFDAIASQVRRLAAEVQQLGSSRQITVLKGMTAKLTKLKLTGNPRGRLVTYSETQSLMILLFQQLEA